VSTLIKAASWTRAFSFYGSEGWEFESLRARKIKGRSSCGNVDQPPLVFCPLWTCCDPGVIRCFGSVQTGSRRCVLIRAGWSSILDGAGAVECPAAGIVLTGI
jgi:hypothetical protein